MKAHGSSQDRGNSGLRVESASAVASSSIPQPKASLQDLARLFLSLSVSRAQWDAVVGSVFSAAAGSGAGSLPGPAATVPVAAPSECLSASVPTPCGGSPTGAASATGRKERSRKSSRSSSGEKSHLSKRRRGGRSLSPARSSHLASASSSSSAYLVADVPETVMPPPPAGRFGAGCGRSDGAWFPSRTRSPPRAQYFVVVGRLACCKDDLGCAR